MPGRPLIIRHLGQKGFYLLSSNLNGTLEHRWSRQGPRAPADTQPSGHQPLPRRGRQGHRRVKEPHLGEVKVGLYLLLSIYHGLNSEDPDKWDMTPGFWSPLFNVRDDRQVNASGSKEVMKGNSSRALKGPGRMGKGDGYAASRMWNSIPHPAVKCTCDWLLIKRAEETDNSCTPLQPGGRGTGRVRPGLSDAADDRALHLRTVLSQAHPTPGWSQEHTHKPKMRGILENTWPTFLNNC